MQNTMQLQSVVHFGYLTFLSLFYPILEIQSILIIMVNLSTPQLCALGMLSNPSHVSRRTSGVIPMRIFLVQTAKGLFCSSGGYKANISLLRHLASRGHSVLQLCYSYRGEVETYVQTMAKSGGYDLHLQRRLLHLSDENNTSGTDIKVDDLIMEDGIQLVSLEYEAFEAAFGGRENIYNVLATETADYIEVN
jgi:hypothetical protein